MKTFLLQKCKKISLKNVFFLHLFSLSTTLNKSHCHVRERKSNLIIVRAFGVNATSDFIYDYFLLFAYNNCNDLNETFFYLTLLWSSTVCCRLKQCIWAQSTSEIEDIKQNHSERSGINPQCSLALRKVWAAFHGNERDLRDFKMSFIFHC